MVKPKHGHTHVGQNEARGGLRQSTFLSSFKSRGVEVIHQSYGCNQYIFYDVTVTSAAHVRDKQESCQRITARSGVKPKTTMVVHKGEGRSESRSHNLATRNTPGLLWSTAVRHSTSLLRHVPVHSKWQYEYSTSISLPKKQAVK